MAMDRCCCFSLWTGCLFIGIFCAIENLCILVTIAVRYQQTQGEIPDEIEHKVMSSFLIYLCVLTGTMFLFSILFIFGTVHEWKHVIFGWVVVYTLLISMRCFIFLAAGVLCIMIPTCNSISGIVLFSAGYIPMALHAFFVMVVYGFYRYLEPIVHELPIFLVSARGASLKKESPKRIGTLSPKRASNKPSPKQSTNKPNPKEAATKPNPKEATNKPNPKESTNIANPKEATNKPNPKEATNIANPKRVSTKPNPKEATNIANPAEAATKRNPKEATNIANPKEVTNKPNPKEATTNQNPKEATTKPDPKEATNIANLEEVANKRNTKT